MIPPTPPLNPRSGTRYSASRPDAPDVPWANPADLLNELRDAMARRTLQLVSIRPDPTWPRNRAARLIRETRRQHGRDRAIPLGDAFAERVALCTIDGGQSDREAERIALEELRNLTLSLNK